MKYFLILFFTILISCKTSNIKKDKNIAVASSTDNKSTEKATNHVLLATLKASTTLDDAKNLVQNSGLTWKKLILNQNSLKAALIEVPSDKKNFWLEKLKGTHIFKDIQPASKNNISVLKEKYTNIFVKISKTECFGLCPVYEVIVFKNGKVSFNGIKHVNATGHHHFVLSDKKMNQIKELFSNTSFANYETIYEDKYLKDVPSTFITYGDKQIIIKRWKNVPEALTIASKAIENILHDKKMIK